MALLAPEASNTEAWHKGAAQRAEGSNSSSESTNKGTPLGHLWDNTGSSGWDLHRGLFLTLSAEKHRAKNEIGKFVTRHLIFKQRE